jgi:hypothetical protein
LTGLKYLIHDARHASYLLQVERYDMLECYENFCAVMVFFSLCLVQ